MTLIYELSRSKRKAHHELVTHTHIDRIDDDDAFRFILTLLCLYMYVCNSYTWVHLYNIHIALPKPKNCVHALTHPTHQTYKERFNTFSDYWGGPAMLARSRVRIAMNAISFLAMPKKTNHPNDDVGCSTTSKNERKKNFYPHSNAREMVCLLFMALFRFRM